MEEIQSNAEVKTFCPICGGPVTKVRETDHVYAHPVECGSEFYRHDGEKLIKFITPKGAWEDTEEFKQSNGKMINLPVGARI